MYVEFFLEKWERENDMLVKRAKKLHKGDVDIN